MTCTRPQIIGVTRGTFHTIYAIGIVGAILNFSPRTGCHVRIEDKSELGNLVSRSVIIQIDLEVCGVLWSAIRNDATCRISEHHKSAITILRLRRRRQLIVEIEALIVILIITAIVIRFAVQTVSDGIFNNCVVASSSDASIARL